MTSDKHLLINPVAGSVIQKLYSSPLPTLTPISSHFLGIGTFGVARLAPSSPGPLDSGFLGNGQQATQAIP